MLTMLKKELRLCLHPTSILFMFLAAMLLIPNYPYYVISFYMGLGIFFICLQGRENNDVFYTLTLPVAKKEIVKARIVLAVLLEVMQIVIAVPFAILRQSMQMPENAVGMDANIAFFGLSFILFGLFNFVFFTKYYKDVTKVGMPFALASTAVFVYMGIMETLTHAVPFFKDKLDTTDTVFVKEKLIVLIVGIVLFALLTLLTYKKSVKSFEKLDI